jgi:hypothetical protein
MRTRKRKQEEQPRRRNPGSLYGYSLDVSMACDAWFKKRGLSIPASEWNRVKIHYGLED